MNPTAMMTNKTNELGINLNVGSQVDERFRQLIASIPAELKKIAGIGELDPFVLAEKFFNSNNVADASIDPNANMGNKSPVSFQSEIFKPQLKYRSYYEMWKRMVDSFGLEEANEAIRACVINALYFHDITKIDEPYCFAFDTSFMMQEGRPYGWLPSVAPKRSSSFMSQLVESTMDMSQEHAGAIGIANLIVNLAYYTRKERAQLHHQLIAQMARYQAAGLENSMVKELMVNAILVYVSAIGQSAPKAAEVMLDADGKVEMPSISVTDGLMEVASDLSTITFGGVMELADRVYNKYVQNLFQNFVHIMHNTFRIGGDSPFTNMSLFDHLTFQTVFADAKYPDYSAVVDNYAEVETLQKVFVEFFYTGSPTNGKNYRFPVTTVNIKTASSGRIEDREFFEYMVLKNKVRGAFNIHVGEKVATCCRLTSDLSILKDQIRMDTFGNGGLSIGSHRVVAVNLHRMALLARYTNKSFDEVLMEHLKMVEHLLITHKALLKERIDQKFLKFFNIGWEDINMFFSTIGYTGLIDAYAVNQGVTIEDVVADEHLLAGYVDFASKTIDIMETFAHDAGKRTPGFAYNVEEIPGENASPKMAQSDNFIFKDKPDYVAVDLLSNQMVPLYCNVPMMQRLEISGKLMNKVSGGSILHLNLTEQVTDEAYLELITMMIERYKIPHFALNVGTSICPNGHTTPGIMQYCPVCGAEHTDFNVRVVGFNTDVSSWSKERRDEFKRRQFYGASDVDLTAKNIL